MPHTVLGTVRVSKDKRNAILILKGTVIYLVSGYSLNIHLVTCTKSLLDSEDTVISKTQDTRSLPSQNLPSSVMVLNSVGTVLFYSQLLKICANVLHCQLLVDAVGIGWARMRETGVLQCT